MTSTSIASMAAACITHFQKLSMDGAYEENGQMLPYKDVLGSLGEEVLPRLHELLIGFDGITELAEKQLNLAKNLEALQLVFGDFVPQSQLLGTYHLEISSLRRLSTCNIDDLDWSSCAFDHLESLFLKESSPHSQQSNPLVDKDPFPISPQNSILTTQQWPLILTSFRMKFPSVIPRQQSSSIPFTLFHYAPFGPVT